MKDIKKHSVVVPDCQCDGPGHCSVYNTHMTQTSYENCKHNRLWRKDALRFFNIVNSPEFQVAVEKKPEYQAKLKWEESYREAFQKEQELNNKAAIAAEEAYIAVRKKQEQEYLDTLTPEEQEAYHVKRAQAIAYQQSQQFVDHKLNEAISTMAQEGITPENYEEKKEGLGDAIGKALSKIGITSEGMEKLLGTHGGCGCDKRKQFLNKIFPFKNKE